ncbi:MAG: hypothetical protein IKA70_00685 [Alistipes sp.]|nr:hypothetical protein [Alistipes sp.]
MNKMFLSAIALLLSVVAYADDTKTCRVLETDGSVEVSVMVTDESTGKCIVSFSNDTERNVNVRYVVYDEVSCKRLPGSKLVYSNSEATREVVFGIPVKSGRVKITSLTGEKCK